MTNSTQEDFFLKRLNKAIEKVDLQAGRLLGWTRVIRYSVLVLSAISTTLLGLTVRESLDYPVYSRNAVLVMGALSTLLAGLSAFWNIDSYAAKQKVLYSRLRTLHERYEFQKARNGDLTEDEIAKFFDEYQKLMNQRIEYWDQRASNPAGQIPALPSSPSTRP